ncbi:hypothetical protein [Tessaracoccus massiliensis]|uniref:hypothetical protein n=1 Tax=Tessaracoccus massiliensis TaxID=1522311 RepID=UPI00058EB4EC|nr:hypothetical protein [Tessaracoccus massiliensis]
MTTLNPAERYAALKLLESGLKAALADAVEAAEEYRQAVGAKSLESRFGDVSITRRKPTAAVDEAALLAWAEEHAPHIIVRAIDPIALAALKAGLKVDGDDVLNADGEVVEWAAARPGSEFLTWRASAEAKADAAAAIAERLDATITAALPA